MQLKGFDELSKQLEEAQAALASLDGELGTVSFDPNDPASIECAIQSVFAIVDERVQAYSENSIVASLAENMKESYRNAIIAKAAESRSQGGDQ